MAQAGYGDRFSIGQSTMFTSFGFGLQANSDGLQPRRIVYVILKFTSFRYPSVFCPALGSAAT